MGMEPEVSNVVDSAQKARRLMDEMGSSRLKVIMDGANLFHTGELPRMREVLNEAFALLGSDLTLAHAKDLDRGADAVGRIQSECAISHLATSVPAPGPDAAVAPDHPATGSAGPPRAESRRPARCSRLSRITSASIRRGFIRQ